ncbi:MAG: DUF3883 domain-containing protein [Bacteroidales bacterium]|nr:DUF3883 domain-containing protein [Bacteroidales bacterium]
MESWAEIEVELIIADYFQMLSKELASIQYSKAAYRKNLLPLLRKRSQGSIEFKHQNISAILINLGLPYIKGYLPRFNYQKLLEEKVIDYLKNNYSIENEFRNFTDKVDIKLNEEFSFDKILVNPPNQNIIQDPMAYYGKNPIKINYLEREQMNSKLGLLGEKLVLKYEKWNLIRNGKENLADQVKWISNEEGDGVGFDILSKNLNGTDKYIEVKTTRLGKETPFFFSRNELLFSINNSKSYNLVRLFNFESNTKMFVKSGGLDTICYSVPISFKGYF